MRLARYALAAVAALVVAAAPVSAQTQYTIQGLVRDAATGDGISGVQVQLRGTDFGTITDAAGRYMLRADVASGSYEITYTFIGRSAETRSIELGGEATVQVPAVYLAESALELEELVVTGTTAPTARRAIGNAITSVSETQLEATPAVTVDQALQGKVSGALITSNTGNPGGGVSVRLRGTSSIIGGAEPLIIVDGVIMDNSSDQILNFGYRSNPSNRLADLDPADIERIEIIKGAAAAALYGSRANNGVIQIFTKRGSAGEPQITVSTELRRSSLPDEIDFALTPVDEDGTPVQRYDHQDLIFEPGYSNETHVSVSGGTEGTKYYLSGGYTSEEGIMIGSDYERYSARLNLDQNFGDAVTVSAGLNYIRSNNDLLINGENGTGGILTAIVFTPTTVDLAERDPETGELVNNAFVFPNPLSVIEDWSAPQDISRVVGSFLTRAALTDDITLRYSFGYDTYAMETAQFIPRGAQLAPLGRASSYVRDKSLINNDVVGNLEWGLGSALDMTTSIGLNHTYTREENLAASATDLSPLTELVRGATQSASESMVETTTLGVFGQQQFAYDQRLFLTGALRWDASSTFGEDERWQLYPKVSGSWLISDEDFWGGLDWFDELRLRAALGYAGNQPPRNYAYARFSRFVNTVHIDRLALVHSGTSGNPDLKPERQREYELGFDASMFDSRVGLAFTYYDQRTEDLLLERPFAPSTGYNIRLDNVGVLTNKGIELELNTTNLDRENFRWNSTFIYSMNDNEMVELAGDPFSEGYNNWVIEGEPLGIFKMPAFERDADGNIVMDEVGPVRSDTSRIVGNPWPDFQASLRNEFRLGDAWSLSFLFDGQFGHEIWNQTQRIMDIFDAGPLYDQFLRGEITEDYRGRVQGIWEAYLEDASFIKLRDVSLIYRVPSSFADRLSLSALQLELKGRDLYTWTDYTGYDPEVNMFGLSTVARGTDFAVYPHARTFTFGVRATY